MRQKPRQFDPSWELPVLEGAVMAKYAKALMKRGRKAKQDQPKLQWDILEKKLRESVSAMAPERATRGDYMIIKRDKMRQNHKIIQRRLKRARTQLKCAIGDDGQRIPGSDMPKVFVEYNAEHFQQPRWNGATAADQGDFCNGLRLYRTPDEALTNNTFNVLREEFDEFNIKQSEVPFYNMTKCTPQPITTISEEIPFNEFQRFWATIKERKSSSLSGRHVGI